MSESTYQSSYGSSAPDMGAAAAEFRRNVQEASERLSNAGQQLVSLSEGLAKAIGEAKAAAERAEQAHAKTEALQASLQHDYGTVTDLVRDLQERIGALAILARPLPGVTNVEPPAQADAAAEYAPVQVNEAEAELESIADPQAAQPEEPSTPPPSTGYGESSGQSWPSRNW
jgi:chromosome segregation ATPase